MSELSSKAKQGPSLKARALRLLSSREYSRKNLASKLEESMARSMKKDLLANDAEPKLATTEITKQIEAVLDDFEARGWLSDERFAEALVRRRSERYGARKIQEELLKAGVDGKKTAGLLQGLRETERERAQELWQRKFGVLAQDQKERARQYRFLASKGFSAEVVGKIVGGRPQD